MSKTNNGICKDYILRKIENIFEALEIEYFTVNKTKLYKLQEENFCRLDYWSEQKAIILETASKEEVKSNLFEDSDIYYLDDYPDEQALCEAIRAHLLKYYSIKK